MRSSGAVRSLRAPSPLVGALLLLLALPAVGADASFRTPTARQHPSTSPTHADFGVRASAVGPGHFVARNEDHGLEARWANGLFEIVPLEATDTWVFRQELVGIGRGAAASGSVAPSVSAASAEGPRLEWKRGAQVLEWFENDALGVKQGFRLQRRPPGPPGEALVLSSRITGLRAFVSGDRAGVRLDAPDGRPALRVSGLLVTDAQGRELPASFAAGPGALRLEIDDAGAAYPVTIDPHYSTPVWWADGLELGANFGQAAWSAGDVNGDGYGDLIVGEEIEDGDVRGRAYLYLGSPSGLSRRAAWSVEGVLNDLFAYSLSVAGDVNGDGFSDVILGAPLDGGGVGAAFVYHGSPAGLPETPSWSVTGDGLVTLLGSWVAAAGDVDDDGFGDVLVVSHG